MGNHLQQLAASDLGLDENYLPLLANTMQSEYVRGEIDAYGDNIRGLLLPNE